jgi:hypothetical protein
MMSEKSVRTYANHLALSVHRRGRVLALHWRYGDRRKIGAYRTWHAVERALRAITVDDLEGNH